MCRIERNQRNENIGFETFCLVLCVSFCKSQQFDIVLFKKLRSQPTQAPQSTCLHRNKIKKWKILSFMKFCEERFLRFIEITICKYTKSLEFAHITTGSVCWVDFVGGLSTSYWYARKLKVIAKRLNVSFVVVMCLHKHFLYRKYKLKEVCSIKHTFLTLWNIWQARKLHTCVHILFFTRAAWWRRWFQSLPPSLSLSLSHTHTLARISNVTLAVVFCRLTIFRRIILSQMAGLQVTQQFSRYSASNDMNGSTLV
jgi:hypothetical protein